MRRHFPRATSCQLCDFISSKPRSSLLRPLQRNLSSSQPWQQKPRVAAKQKPIPVKPAAVRNPSLGRNNQENTKQSLATQNDQEDTKQSQGQSATQYDQLKVEKLLSQVAAQRDALLASESVPTEDEIIQALSYCEVLASNIHRPIATPVVSDSKKETSSSNALLSLEERTLNARQKEPQDPPAFINSAIEQLSKIAYSIIEHKNIFVTPQVLSLYVKIQAKLGKPESIPDAFYLYANKPIPLQGQIPIRYSKPRPNKISNAIPKSTAIAALNSAIDAHDLVAALDIIKYTFATKAYRRAKMLRQMSLPVTAIVGAPFAMWVLARKMAEYQKGMDTELAQQIAFGGLISYLAVTGSMGFIAMSTANDQMERVSWAPGERLMDRWVREEERAAYDTVACAWGFKERWRRGEEEGEEWDALRETCGMEGMILDRTSLMDDME